MIPKLLYVIHVLGAVFWVGGMAFALMALRPAAEEALEGPPRLALMRGALRRFFLIVWHAMPLLLLTGWGLLFGWYGGFRGAGWHIHVMHLTGLLMAAIYLAIFFGPWRAVRAGNGAAMGRVRQLVGLNFVLGVATVAVAAWGRFGG
jgi:uncharacterized membrane protein